MAERLDLSRRTLLVSGASAAAAALVAGCGGPEGGPGKNPKSMSADEAGISPTEDLMQEHGLLERLLLIYEECARSIEGLKPPPAQVIPQTAEIVGKFVQNYHERHEEDYLFPRFRKANKLTDLVDVLYQQHQAGRQLTARIADLTEAGVPSAAADQRHLAEHLRAFVRMYRPHAAREDTVLYVEFRNLLSAAEFHDMGERFEDSETKLFGEKGFEKEVAKVAKLEDALGIYTLAQFTPQWP